MRRIFTLAALAALFCACVSPGAPGPRATVEKAMNALKGGDGKALVECMSAASLAELENTVTEMKANPEETAQMMGIFGVQITADEIRNLDVAGFMTLMMNSELFPAELKDMTVTYGEERIEGDEAWVQVTIDGEAEEVRLLKENGRWVIDEGFDMM